jgi:hypothetical protein
VVDVTDAESPKIDDPIWPTCPECGVADGISLAVLDPAEDTERGRAHTVARYELACGHTWEDPPAVMSADMVDMIRLLEPDADRYLTVRGGRRE